MKIIYVFLSFIFFLFFSCSEKGTNPEEGMIGFSFYSGKCGQDLQKKSGIQDSSFEYTFLDNLLIDLAVPGNCCPDSNRFIVSQNILNDTINISVEDTASNQCRCICNYHIYVQFNDLPENHYVVLCTLIGADNNNPLYIADVYRMHGFIWKNPIKTERG